MNGFEHFAFELKMHKYQRVSLATLTAVSILGLVVAGSINITQHFSELVLSSPPGSAARDKAPPHSVQPASPGDSVIAVPAGFRDELISALPLTGAIFSRSFRAPIDRFCDSLGSLGLGKFTAMQNPIADEQWICSSDVLPVGKRAASPDASSVFVWITGTHSRRVNLVRLKVNLVDPTTSGAAKSMAIAILQKLHGLLNWDAPEGLMFAVQNARETSLSHYGINYRVTREWSMPLRLNIIIQVADRSGIIPIYYFSNTSEGF